jgi:uncharacterized membrane protein
MAHFHVLVGATTTPAQPAIRTIGPADLKRALIKGFEDFSAFPSHAVFLCLVYPVIGIILGRAMLGYAVLPLLFPLAAGFALLGPLAAIGLYEMSRRREAGLPVSWHSVFEIIRSPSIGAIAALGLLLMVIFLVWLATAQGIYGALFGYDHSPASVEQFVQELFFTWTGWKLILIGNGVGFLFALVVLTISVVSFPLLVEHDVGAPVAVVTSIRAVLANPGAMALWGLIVAALLAIGSLPFFIGLTVVMPVLGHATWHLYRRVVSP